MGCPNLPVSASDPSGPRGCLFVAVKGQGAFQVSEAETYGKHHAWGLRRAETERGWDGDGAGMGTGWDGEGA